ncbi:hypothetical protein MUP77_11500, partial [Candidatus Bathyarchaeota archaeon]|nr:hypothetical protein [Candidatus Bathyarchaeota archaeon]
TITCIPIKNYDIDIDSVLSQFIDFPYPTRALGSEFSLYSRMMVQSLTNMVECCICGKSVKREDVYQCLKCGRFYCTECMTDSITVCPDCESH